MRILLICNYKPGVGGISGQVELLQKHLREDGHVADIFSTKAPVWRRLLLPLRLRRVAKGYDLLHIHCCSGWGFLPAVIGVTVGKQLKKRLVLTYHGGGGGSFFAKHLRLVRHYLDRTDINIVLSGFLAQVFDRYKLSYTIISNIIDLDESYFRQRETPKPDFICTRAHEPLYNIPCILKAFGRVQAKLPEATLTLVGDGTEHGRLMQLAKEMNLHNVNFTGKVDNKEIHTLLDQADIFLSAPTVDNMPVSILESMNSGLLVISSRVGGVPYMIDDGKTGLLFDSDDNVQLSERMLSAVRKPETTRGIVERARQEVGRYRWANIKEKLYTAYGIPT